MDAVASYFAPDATLTLPGLTPIQSRSAIRSALVQLSLALDELHHEPVQLWTSGSLSVFEADVTLRLDGRRSIRIPVTHVLRWEGGAIQEVGVCVYLESRLALALSAFERARFTGAYFGPPSHRSIGLRTPSGRNGSAILRPCPADA